MDRIDRIMGVLAEHGGICTREQLLRRGIRGPELSRAVRAGAIRRVRRAHYATYDAPLDAIAAVRVGGRLGCVSAARSFGIWIPDPGCTHVALPKNAARLRTNRALVPSAEPITSDRQLLELELHWCDSAFGRRKTDESAWRVSPRDALAQVARCASRLEVIAAFESAVHQGVLTLTDARQLLATSAPRRLRGLQLHGFDGSGAETYLADAMRAVGLAFIQQVPFDGAGWVDFIVEGRLAVEVDGYAYHHDRDAFERDRRRDAALLARGIPTLRIPAREVLADPAAAALRVVAALAGLAAA
ncbi:type IV toxin-antitoxin system AbiEi family antitoxin domain-containing protein [Agromyces intestinalis]|nr:type IV toxin-antitoxin system AbiEi family antitoxin domain-containing protein [Agromyces intestinalis]